VHEAKLCLSLIRLAERHRERSGAERLLVLRVAVGALSGVAPEALEAVFPICAAGTGAEGATLSIERTEGRELVLTELEVL
jgi:hydrogenase nickel incorporation protein HypA/HybF